MGLIGHHGLLQKVLPAISFVTELGSGESFNATITTLLPTIVNWEFGDGAVSNGNIVSHTYSIGGDKHIKIYFEKNAVTNNIRLENNKIKGELDLSSILESQGVLTFFNNPKITSFILPQNYSSLSYLYIYQSGVVGVLDVSGIRYISNTLRISQNPDLTGLILPNVPFEVRQFRFYQNGFTGVLDLSSLTGITQEFLVHNNPNLTELIFPSKSFQGSNFNFYSNGIIGILDISGITGILTNVDISKNANMTSVQFSENIGASGSLWIYENPILSGLDLSSFSSLGNYVVIRNNPNLASITFPSVTYTGEKFNVHDCALNLPFPLGTVIQSTSILLQNNGMDTNNVNSSIDSLYVNRAAFNNAVVKFLNIGGTNAAPTGIYIAPAGYVQAGSGVTGNDGSPTTAKEKLFVLANQNIDNSTEKKYKWTFTVTGGL